MQQWADSVISMLRRRRFRPIQRIQQLVLLLAAGLILFDALCMMTATGHIF